MTYDDILRNVRCCADRFCKNCSLQGKPMCKETLFAFVWDTMYNTKVENEKLKKKLDSIKLKMQPTAASGYKYENGNIVFFTDILNGYREEYDTTDKIVSQLNLLRHECYRLMECESHLRLKQTPLMCNPSVINHGMGVSGEYDIDHHLLCPSCNSVVGDCDIMELNGNYCSECGQRIALPDEVYLRQIEFDKYKNCPAESEGDVE